MPDLPLSLPVITDRPSLLGPLTLLGASWTDRCLDGLCGSFRRAGLPVHEVTSAALSAETLSVRIIPSHGACGHTDKRILRLRSALRVLMHRRRVSGRVVQLIAGHLSFGAVASRGALSLLELGVSNLAAKHWMSRGIPWDSLKCELRAYAGLLSLF